MMKGKEGFKGRGRLFWLGCLGIGMMAGAGCQTGRPLVAETVPPAPARTILVLPPVNESVHVPAGASLLSQSVRPLAEAGYYVLPVALVTETFRENGYTEPEMIRQISRERLREIFGADAVLLMTIRESGTEYKILASDTRVTAAAQLRDLESGRILWRGAASASSHETSGSSHGLAGMLVEAVVDQVLNTVTDRSHDVAAVTAWRLFHPQSRNGLPPGPLLREAVAANE